MSDDGSTFFERVSEISRNVFDIRSDDIFKRASSLIQVKINVCIMYPVDLFTDDMVNAIALAIK